MTSEQAQIVNLVKSKNEKIENICHKEVHKIKITKEDGNNPIFKTILFLILKAF